MVFMYIIERICVFPFHDDTLSISQYIKNNKFKEYQENKNLIMYFNNFGYGYCIRVKNKVKLYLKKHRLSDYTKSNRI